MTAVAFDFDDVLPTVHRAHSAATHDDAEDAVQTAVAEGIEKGWDLTTRNVIACARFRLLSAMERRERRNLSLDALREDTEDHAPAELAVDEVDFDSHLQLSTVAIDARRRAIEGGCRSTRGWTADNVLLALRDWTHAHGHPPDWRDCPADPELPHPSTIRRFHGTLNRALAAAGLETRPYLCAGKEWTYEKGREALRRYVAEHGRLPTANELRSAEATGLPAQMVCYRLFGSVSRRRLAEVAFGEGGARLMAAIAILRAPGRGQNADLASRLEEFCGG